MGYYDFLSLYSSFDEFAFKNEMPGDISAKIKAIVEELVFGMLMPMFKKDRPERGKIIVNVGYNRKEQKISIR